MEIHLSPTLFLQVLQVKAKEPHLNEREALIKAKQQLFPPSPPLPLSQQDINEVLTTLVSTPSPDYRGHG